MAATRFTSTSSRHRHPRPNHSPPYPLRSENDKDSDTSVSDFNKQEGQPDVRGIRKVRPKFFRRSGEGHQTETNKRRMASHTPRRTHSDSKTYRTNEPRVPLREVPRKHSSEPRPRRLTTESKDDDEVVYIYKTNTSSKDRTDKTWPSVVRRSNTSGDVSRVRYERSYKDKEPSRRLSEIKESTRRHSERRPLYREERVYTAMRPNKSTAAVPKNADHRGEPQLKRSVSARESSTISLLRPFLPRSKTTAQKPRPSSYVLPATPRIEERMERRSSTAREAKAVDRSSGIFSSFIGPSKAPPKAKVKSDHVKKSEVVKKPEPEKKVECLTCLSDVPTSRTVKLRCSHRMCHSCLRRVFNLSVTDPQHMPPKCCTADAIPLEYVDKLFDITFKKLWNRKYQEYTTKNRIYCPARGCGTWIKPSHIHVDTSGGANHGRKYGKCQRCQTKVCCLCNNRWHTSRECPKDAATQEFIRIAKEEGWQRCYNCTATVELKEGCNHMTCRCRAEFCMICGLKWKTCDCPWFNYETVEADRLNHMQIPEVNPVQLRPDPGRMGNNPARGYQEQMDRRREQERRDEDLARRMEVLGLDGDLENGFGNAAGHFMNQDFVNRAHDILSGNFNMVQADAADRLVNAAHNFYRQQAPGPQLPQPPQRPPILRQHTTAPRNYNNRPTTRASERVVLRRTATDYQTEAERHRPVSAVGGTVRERRRASEMAGMSRRTTEGRVDAWRRHVDADGTASVAGEPVEDF